MQTRLNESQFNHLVSYISKEYEIFAPQRDKNGGIIFDKLKTPSDFYTGPQKNSVMPFKKILFPNGFDESAPIFKDKKIALVGLTNCDGWALEYFLNEFLKTDLLPSRESILVLTRECFFDNNCFCDFIGTNKPANYDFWLQQEKNGDFSVQAQTLAGKKIFSTLGFKESKKVDLRFPDSKKPKVNEAHLSQIIAGKNENLDFWQGIADNCFGCGACSAVCPLCFCTRQNFANELDGCDKKCLVWDSCFAKRFSEIQNHFDLRAENRDRLYNWYHHKFVRAKEESDHFLCTGCGRCVEACPANLNVKNIIKNLVNHDQ